MLARVTKVGSEVLIFDNGAQLYSNHNTDCCESHYLSMSDLTIEDFDGLEFDLESDELFERIPNYGIALKPVFGHPVRIPGYVSNNGYYSSNLELIITDFQKFTRKFDITECQSWDD